MLITHKDLDDMDRLRRLNIVNSITGIKPANLIGSISSSGVTNLAVFSSVVHLSSQPALIGFMLRPSGEVRRDTYENIMETGVYTINAVHDSFTEKAHFTSAKFDRDQSEFNLVGLQEEYLADCKAPFVKESRLKFSLEFRQKIPIDLNATCLIIGEVRTIILDEEAVAPEGHVDLAKLSSAGISGLNTYYELTQQATYPYARPTELPDFDKTTSPLQKQKI